jgi:hypothetical protein
MVRRSSKLAEKRDVIAFAFRNPRRMKEEFISPSAFF